MKKLMYFYLFAVVFVLLGSPLYAQVVKVSGGWANTAMQNNKNFNGMLNEEISAFSALVGIDYWEQKHYYLSSEVGYFRDGGQQKDLIGNNNILEASEYWNYIHFNTTFRFKLPLANAAHLYAGAGPKVDVLFGTSQFKSDLYNEHTNFKKNRFSFGGKAEAGIVQDISRIRIGLNISYLLHSGAAGGNNFTSLLRENNVSLALSLGYRLD